MVGGVEDERGLGWKYGSSVADPDPGDLINPDPTKSIFIPDINNN